MAPGYHNIEGTSSANLALCQDPGFPKTSVEIELWRRFWSKVEQYADDACWPWKAGRAGVYGSFRYEGRSLGAHKVAWILARGPVPDGFDVCHSCDNPPCCNPRHLFVGSHLDNMRDSARKGRRKKAQPSRRRLSTEDVAMIGELVRAGLSHADAGRRFGVTQAYVSMIIRGTRRQYDAPRMREEIASQTRRGKKPRLTTEQVSEIRTAVRTGPRGTATEIARAYHITTAYVSILMKSERKCDQPIVPLSAPQMEQAS